MITKASKLKSDLGFATGQEMVREKNSEKFTCLQQWQLALIAVTL